MNDTTKLTSELRDHTTAPLYGSIFVPWDGEQCIVRVGNVPGERGGISFLTHTNEARSFVNDLNECLWRATYPHLPMPDELRWEGGDDTTASRRDSVQKRFGPPEGTSVTHVRTSLPGCTLTCDWAEGMPTADELALVSGLVTTGKAHYALPLTLTVTDAPTFADAACNMARETLLSQLDGASRQADGGRGESASNEAESDDDAMPGSAAPLSDIERVKCLMAKHTPAELATLARCFQMASYFAENETR